MSQMRELHLKTTAQTFQKHLFFHLFGLENPKFVQKIQNSEISPPPLLLRPGEYTQLKLRINIETKKIKYLLFCSNVFCRQAEVPPD